MATVRRPRAPRARRRPRRQARRAGRGSSEPARRPAPAIGQPARLDELDRAATGVLVGLAELPLELELAYLALRDRRRLLGAALQPVEDMGHASMLALRVGRTPHLVDDARPCACTSRRRTSSDGSPRPRRRASRRPRTRRARRRPRAPPRALPQLLGARIGRAEPSPAPQPRDRRHRPPTPRRRGHQASRRRTGPMLHCRVFLPCPAPPVPERRQAGGAASDRRKEDRERERRTRSC